MSKGRICSVVGIAGAFRNLLIMLRSASRPGELIDSDTALLAEQAQQAEAGRLLRMTEILMDTLDRMRYAFQRTLVETALIRCPVCVIRSA